MKLNQLLKELGMTQEQVAKEVGIGKAAVSAWNRNGIPVKYCVQLERIAQGKFTRKDFRPADWQNFWPEFAA